jgi:tetratricopeptide (TPR) repeat protein
VTRRPLRTSVFPGLLAAVLGIATPALAQRGATGPIADLNNQARDLSETAPDQSLVVATKAREAARAAGDIRGEAEALNYIAYAHRAQSLLAVSRNEALESVRLYKQVADRWGEAQGYNTLGLIEADEGRFADALEYHLKAMAIREADGDKEGLAYTNNNLGNIYRNMGEFQKALDHHQRGLQLKVELGLKSSEAYSHQNMGLVYFAMKDNAKALAAYQRALAIREQLGDTRAVAVSLNAIGSVEVLTNPEAALRTYERSLELRRKNQDLRGEMATELNIADVYRRMGRLGPATQTIERVMALGTKIDAPLMHANALKALSEIDALRGDYSAAYRHVLEHQAKRDAIFNQQTAERFHHLEAAQETERQQQQIQLLERENELRESELRSVRTSRMMLTVIAGLVIVSLVLLYARYRLKHESVLLRGLLPICAWCKKIRDDKGYWTQVESYITSHSKAEFTHCICPACGDRLTQEGRTS